eukprot:207558-Rhodomonas_salina.1
MSSSFADVRRLAIMLAMPTNWRPNLVRQTFPSVSAGKALGQNLGACQADGGETSSPPNSSR